MLYYPQQEERQSLYPLCRKKRAMMEYRNWNKNDIRTSLLGYGCMRFPTKADGTIDEERAEALLNTAKAAGVKSVAMIHVADINKVTGYIRGGCSPVGMKKQFVTVFDESCLAQDTMLVSGGRIGTQIECSPADLIKVTRGKTAAITQEHDA